MSVKKRMKALIIDDESKARKLLSTIIQDYCPEIEQVAERDNLLDGVAFIKEEQPNLVFLDIEMPDHLGTQIVDFLDPEEFNFKIIFTTAHQKYAVKAFEMNAVDYLLKPLRPNQVKIAVDKAMEELQTGTVAEQLLELQKTFKENHFKKIGLPVADGILFVPIEDIICMEADGMYTKIYTTSEGSQVISKPLKYFIDLLGDSASFYRPHRSYFINIKFVKQYVKRDGNYIVMDNDMIVSISKDKKEEFLTIVSTIS